MVRALIALILKEENPISFKQFRPLSLCNVIYNLITKFLLIDLDLITWMIYYATILFDSFIQIYLVFCICFVYKMP